MTERNISRKWLTIVALVMTLLVAIAFVLNAAITLYLWDSLEADERALWTLWVIAGFVIVGGNIVFVSQLIYGTYSGDSE